MDEEITTLNFAIYRLERAKQDLSDAEYCYNGKTKIQIDTAREVIKLVEEYINKEKKI